MKLGILIDIHKICIFGKIFAFHRSTKDICHSGSAHCLNYHRVSR